MHGGQAHDLGAHDTYTPALGLGLHQLHHPVQGGLVQVGHVDGDLSDVPVLQHDAQSLDAGQAAAGLADDLGDGGGDGDIGGVQVDIEGNQGHPAAHSHGTGGGMDGTAAEIRLPLRQQDLLGHALELALADGSQVHTVGSGSGILVQEHGHACLFPDPLGNLLAQFHALLGGHFLHGNEGAHVHGTHSGMLAHMLGQVDQLHGLLSQLHSGLGNALRAAQEGDDGAVMVGVGAVVQQGDTGGGADLIQDCLHNFHISAFRDIGNTFNNLSHSN